MAITKKSSTRRRKPGAKTGRKRKARVKGSPITTQNAGDYIAISGVGRFKRSTCHKSKTDAQKTAESKRARGAKTRVIKSGTGYCVYTRGRAK